MLVRSTSGFIKYLSLVFLEDGWLEGKKFQEHFSINHGEFFPLAIWNAFLYFFKKNNVCINNLVGMGCKPRWDDHGNHYWWFLVVKQSVPQTWSLSSVGEWLLKGHIWVTCMRPFLSISTAISLPSVFGYLNFKMLISTFSPHKISIHIDIEVVPLIWLCHCFDKILLRTHCWL